MSRFFSIKCKTNIKFLIYLCPGVVVRVCETIMYEKYGNSWSESGAASWDCQSVNYRNSLARHRHCFQFSISGSCNSSAERLRVKSWTVENKRLLSHISHFGCFLDSFIWGEKRRNSRSRERFSAETLRLLNISCYETAFMCNYSSKPSSTIKSM